MVDRVILYVEDDPDDVEKMKASFKRFRVNYALHTVFGGREALHRLKNTGLFIDRVRYPVPQIILLDLVMPEIDGFEVLKQIKTEADLRGIPVFAISGLMNWELRQRAIDLGAIGFILKSKSIAYFVEILAYMNTQLMAAMKYDLLVQYQGSDIEAPETRP